MKSPEEYEQRVAELEAQFHANSIALTGMKEERDQLRADLDETKRTLVLAQSTDEARMKECEAEIDRLRSQLDAAREALRRLGSGVLDDVVVAEANKALAIIRKEGES